MYLDGAQVADVDGSLAGADLAAHGGEMAGADDQAAGRLGLGLSVDFKNKNVRNAQWIYPDNPSDPAVAGTGATSFTPELNFGAYYTTDTWFAGLSTSRLLQSDATFSGSSAR